jgi:hypothetical protein
MKTVMACRESWRALDMRLYNRKATWQAAECDRFRVSARAARPAQPQAADPAGRPLRRHAAPHLPPVAVARAGGADRCRRPARRRRGAPVPVTLRRFKRDEPTLAVAAPAAAGGVARGRRRPRRRGRERRRAGRRTVTGCPVASVPPPIMIRPVRARWGGATSCAASGRRPAPASRQAGRERQRGIEFMTFSMPAMLRRRSAARSGRRPGDGRPAAGRASGVGADAATNCSCSSRWYSAWVALRRRCGSPWPSLRS